MIDSPFLNSPSSSPGVPGEALSPSAVPTLRVPEMLDVEEFVAGGFGVRQNDIYCAMRLLIISDMVETQGLPHFVAEYIWLIMNFTEVDHLLKPMMARADASRNNSPHQRSVASSRSNSVHYTSVPGVAPSMNRCSRGL